MGEHYDPMALDISRHLRKHPSPRSYRDPPRVKRWTVYLDGSWGTTDLYDDGDDRYHYPGGASHIRAGRGTDTQVFEHEADALRVARGIARGVVNAASKRVADATQRLIELGEE